MFDKRRFIVLIMAVNVVFMLSAQSKKPSWTQKEPNKKDEYFGIVRVQKPTPMDTIPFDPEYKIKAVRSALWKVASQMPWEIDQYNSMFAVLSKKGAYKSSLNDVLLGEIQKSPYFHLAGEWEDETEYWCYVSTKKEDAKLFIDQMIEDKKNTASRMYHEAKALQTEGYIYRAAQKYAEALDSLHPAIFRYLPVPCDTGMVDLGQQIYSSYVDVYKGISLTTEVKTIPAVWGEGVPGSFSVFVSQNKVPLRKLGIITNFEGVISADPTTDEKGYYHFSIENITSKSEMQTISIAIDTDYLMDLPLIYGCNVQEGLHLFPSLKIPIYLFNPKTYVKIDTTEKDSLLSQNLKKLWENNRSDAILIERYDSADVVVETSVGIKKEKDVLTNKYQFIQYSTSLEINVKSVANDAVLTKYEIKDFKLMLPASRTEEQVRQSAVREMIRQMNREFASLVKDYKYNKREIVWSSLFATEK